MSSPRSTWRRILGSRRSSGSRYGVSSWCLAPEPRLATGLRRVAEPVAPRVRATPLAAAGLRASCGRRSVPNSETRVELNGASGVCVHGPSKPLPQAALRGRRSEHRSGAYVGTRAPERSRNSPGAPHSGFARLGPRAVAPSRGADRGRSSMRGVNGYLQVCTAECVSGRRQRGSQLVCSFVFSA